MTDTTNATPAAVPVTTPATAPSVQTFTQEEVGRMIAAERARASENTKASVFKDLGADEAQAREALAKHREAQEAMKTEIQRATDVRVRLEKELAEARQTAADAQRDSARLTTFVQANVKHSEVKILGFLLDEATKTDPKLDESKWLEQQRAERPFLFQTTQQAPTPVAPAQAAPLTTGTTPPTGNGQPHVQPFDAMKATAQERQLRARELGIHSERFFGVQGRR